MRIAITWTSFRTSRGRALFDANDRQIDLELLEQATFDRGVTMHRYSIRSTAGQ